MHKAIVIGKEASTHRDVSISAEARSRSTYIIGAPGSGKSALLENIVNQDMTNDDGLCFLDPHEDSAERLLSCVPPSRSSDVIFWDSADSERPFGLNPFLCDDPRMVDNTAGKFVAAMASFGEYAEAFQNAPRMRGMLQNLARTFIINQGSTLVETCDFLTDARFRHTFYPALASRPPLLRFWEDFDRKKVARQDELTESTLNKLDRFQMDNIMRGIFGQSHPKLRLDSAMQEGKIVIIKLNASRLGPDNAALVGAFVIWELFQAALARAQIPEHSRRTFHIIADEFQTFASTALERLIEEVRKYRVDVTIAHQARAQLGDRAQSSTLLARNKIVFQTIGIDAIHLAREFPVTPPEPVITGRRPKLALVPNPLDHLNTHPHENREVVTAHRNVRNCLDKLFDGLKSGAIRPLGMSYIISEKLNDLSEYRHRLEQKINELLYLAMCDRDKPSKTLNKPDFGQWYQAYLDRDKPPKTSNTLNVLREEIDILIEFIYKFRLREMQTIRSVSSMTFGFASFMILNRSRAGAAAEIWDTDKYYHDYDCACAIANLFDYSLPEKRVLPIHEGAYKAQRREITLPQEKIVFDRFKGSNGGFVRLCVNTNISPLSAVEPHADIPSDVDANITWEAWQEFIEQENLRRSPDKQYDAASLYMNCNDDPLELTLGRYHELVAKKRCAWAQAEQQKKNSQHSSNTAYHLPHWWFEARSALFFYVQENAIARAVESLASLLSDQPCYTNTGQYEPIYEQPRSYSDLRDEKVEIFVGLPQYMAQALVIEGGKSVEHTIETYPPPKPTYVGERLAPMIREDSRQNYGCDRGEIEEEIEARFSRRSRNEVKSEANNLSKSPELGTIKHDPPSDLPFTDDDELAEDK